MKTELRDSPFNAWQELNGYQETLNDLKGKHGATAVFVGSMRDMNESSAVKAMFLEHYPEMTSRYLEKITHHAFTQWKILDALVLHRVGHILPEDTIVLVAVWSEHREEAFKASRYILEELKHRAPFWKKETLSDNSQRWVSQNTPSS
ncbi:MAG: molybdopterin converting factor [Gammaproteobacteria bacterium SG8_15]|nr:MAG: molybdopterin converting factor [Gammaproteobacteria bacterium SG8_15]